MEPIPLTADELRELVRLVAQTSKEIRTASIDKTSTPLSKVIQYENMLRVLELFETRPDMVRATIKHAKCLHEDQKKIMNLLYDSGVMLR